MNQVFVDTWAWYALVDLADTDHELAKLANEKLLDEGCVFITTNFVMSETLTLIRYHIHHKAAVRFWHTLHSLIEAHLVQFVRVNEHHEAMAWDIFENYADQKFSYTDCTSFAVMRDLELSHVFTADQHFATLGFIRIP